MVEVKVSEKKDGVKRPILVTGHRNPDTDSICAAISYARLKNKITDSDRYVACRAGEPNAETSFVLDYFKAEKPRLLRTVRTQVCDLEYNEVQGQQRNLSLKDTWNIMNYENINTLPVITERGALEGIITVGDIAKSCMNVYDMHIISNAHTQFNGIVETLEGTLVAGDGTRYCEEGKVIIAPASLELMGDYIEKHDIVILGNRAESLLMALDKEADCIILCEGSQISGTIKRLAEEKGTIIVSTTYDTYTTARLINQAVPISYLMKTGNLITFQEDDFVDDISSVMASKRHRDFPVISKDGHYLGLLSRRNLLGNHGKQVILVDHNEPGQAVEGIGDANILEIIDHHRLGTVQTLAPVYFRNQPVGCTSTIIYQMYQENGIDIDPQTAGLLMSAIISDTLLFRSPTCTPLDEKVARSLAGIAGVNIEKYAMEMFSAGSNLKGKTEKDIFYQDFKRFKAGKVEFGVSQVTSLNQQLLEEMKPKLLRFANEALGKEKLNMSFVMLTNILDQDTMLLAVGIDSGKLVNLAFSVQSDRAEGIEGLDEEQARNSFTALLKGVVSRKKQLVPQLTLYAEQL